MLSAQLDGEDDPGDRAVVDAHLAECDGCRQWLDRAAAVTRLARTSLVTPVPDLSAAVLAKASMPRHPRLARALRLALGAAGAGQLLIGLVQIAQGTAIGHGHADLTASVTPGHLWHESAAWNVAVGAGFLFTAVRRTSPRALLPTLTAFVAMLLLLSIADLAAGRVTPVRLVSHGALVAGYLLIVALSRPALDPGRPPAGRATRPGRRTRSTDQPELRLGSLRLLPPPPRRESHNRRAA